MSLHLTLKANQSNDINNDMIYDSAPDFECQPIKWH